MGNVAEEMRTNDVGVELQEMVEVGTSPPLAEEFGEVNLLGIEVADVVQEGSSIGDWRARRLLRAWNRAAGRLLEELRRQDVGVAEGLALVGREEAGFEEGLLIVEGMTWRWKVP